MKVLTKKDIKDAEDKKTEKIDVPEWGGIVFVRTLTGRERDIIESSIYQASKDNRTSDDVRARLVASAAVDGDGKRLFTEKDISWLNEKSAVALNRVADAARRLAGMMPESISDSEKNLETVQSEDSTSG